VRKAGPCAQAVQDVGAVARRERPALATAEQEGPRVNVRPAGEPHLQKRGRGHAEQPKTVLGPLPTAHHERAVGVGVRAGLTLSPAKGRNRGPVREPARYSARIAVKTDAPMSPRRR